MLQMKKWYFSSIFRNTSLALDYKQVKKRAKLVTSLIPSTRCTTSLTPINSFSLWCPNQFYPCSNTNKSPECYILLYCTVDPITQTLITSSLPSSPLTHPHTLVPCVTFSSSVQLILASVRVSTVPIFLVMSITLGFSLIWILLIRVSKIQTNTNRRHTSLQQSSTELISSI